MEAAAELGRTLLERNRQLESTVRQQQAVIDDQTQEMQVLSLLYYILLWNLKFGIRFFFFFFGSDLTWTMKTRFFALLILADFNLSLSRSRELASVPFVWAVAILHAPLVNEISFYFFFYSFHLFLHLTMAPKCFFVFLIVPYSKETNV